MRKIQLQTSSTNNVLFTNGTTPVFYMRVPVGGMDQNNDTTGNIVFVNATGVTTTYSYIQFNQAKQYKVTLLCSTNPMSSGTLSSH